MEITQPFKSFLLTIADTSKCNPISVQSREILTLIDTLQTTCLTDRKHLEQGKEQTKMLRLFEPRFGPVYVESFFFFFFLEFSYFWKIDTKVRRILVYRKNLLNVFVFDKNINEKLNQPLVHLYSIINLLHEKNLNNKWKSMFF